MRGRAHLAQSSLMKVACWHGVGAGRVGWGVAGAGPDGGWSNWGWGVGVGVGKDHMCLCANVAMRMEQQGCRGGQGLIARVLIL